MHVLVTGGSGAIGRFVVNELHRRGHQTTIFDQKPPNLEYFSVSEREVSYIDGNVTHLDEIAEAVEGLDGIVHLAALLPETCQSNPRLAERVNVGGTLNALEAAADNDIRILCASSKAVFGTISGNYAHPTYEPIGEDGSTFPTDVYGATKFACEQFCRTYNRLRDVDVACFRFASTYGPGKGDTHGAYALLPRMIERSARGDSVSLAGADQRNDFVYYSDLAAGIANAVEADMLNYRVYHLGSGQASSLRDFAAAIREYCPNTDISLDGGLDFFGDNHLRYCRLDISRARIDLGYDPQFDPTAATQDYLARIA